MTSPGSSMDALRRRRAEWSPWLDVIDQVQREIASSRWDSAVPDLVTEREPPAPRLAGVRVTVDESLLREFMDKLEDYLRFVIPFYVAEGKSYLTIAIGCTGGRHRSVMIAERLRKGLGDLGVARVRVRHRDLVKA